MKQYEHIERFINYRVLLNSRSFSWLVSEISVDKLINWVSGPLLLLFPVKVFVSSVTDMGNCFASEPTTPQEPASSEQKTTLNFKCDGCEKVEGCVIL